jgi:hypothetical protein
MVWTRFRDPSDLPIKVMLLIGYRMAVAQRMPSSRNPLRLSDFRKDEAVPVSDSKSMRPKVQPAVRNE